MSQDAAWPASGTVEERAAEVARRLVALIPMDAGAGEVSEARRRLEALGGEPEGEKILASIASGLWSAGAFDLEPVAIQEALQADPIRQQDFTADGLVRTLSTVRLEADRQGVEEALFERPWSWWKNGRVFDWQRTGHGLVRFVLQPVAPGSWSRVTLPAKLGIELAPGESSEESCQGHSRKKILFRARFFRDFHGPGSYEVIEVAGGCVVRSIWEGVERRALTVKLLPMGFFLKIHLGGEKGDLSWPFPSGTGFPGLIESLETL